MDKYYYQVSILTRGLSTQDLLGIEFYQCSSLRAVACLKSMLKTFFSDAKFRVYKVYILSLSDLKDDIVPKPRIVVILNEF